MKKIILYAVGMTLVWVIITLGIIRIASGASVALEWEQGAGATPSGYRVYRARGGICTGWTMIAGQGEALITEKTYKDQTAGDGLTYCYRVTAYLFSDEGEGDQESKPSNVVTVHTPLSLDVGSPVRLQCTVVP